jgi:uncharacterized membrane-anchored protein
VTLREHPLRRQIVSEMHLRRWPPLTAPGVVMQMLRLVSDEERGIERAALETLPSGSECAPSDNLRHASGTLGEDVQFVWEQHSEASTVTLFRMGPDAITPDLATDAPLSAALAWAAGLPGELVRATRILILPDEAGAERLQPQLGFTASDLVSCHIGTAGDDGGARLWSDFRIGPGGFGRLLLAANGMSDGDLSRLVQRLQELGNYRNLALLGLPVARARWSDLDQVERALTALSADVARPDMSDDRLLEGVTALSLDLMSIWSDASFRMNATAAYARLVEERLAELAPHAIRGYPSLADFTQRRLLPAVRTCAAHVQRQHELSMHAHRFASLLRTRIETRIEIQNTLVLESLERSATGQLRLQQLVEGFSVIALSYYAIGLLDHLIEGLAPSGTQSRVSTLLAILVPLVVVGMWWTIHHFKRRALGGAEARRGNAT